MDQDKKQNQFPDKDTKVKIAKIAVGSSLAILIAESLQLKYANSAGIITLLTILDTKKDTFHLALYRFLSFIITILLVVIIYHFLGNHAFAFGVFMLLMVGICYAFGWQGTISVNAVIGTHLLVSGNNIPLTGVTEELILLIIGTSIAISLNLIMPDKRKEIEEDIGYIEEELKTIIHSMAGHLQENQKLTKDKEQISRLIVHMDEAIGKSFHNLNNTLNEHSRFYIEYLSMRKSQCIILIHSYRSLVSIEEMPVQAIVISEHLNYLADVLHERNSASVSIEKLNDIFKDMEQQPLPKTRKEFESRAILYHILKELEEFLRLKKEFVENLTPEQIEIYWK